jgi:hypothetical protein
MPRRAIGEIVSSIRPDRYRHDCVLASDVHVGDSVELIRSNFPVEMIRGGFGLPDFVSSICFVILSGWLRSRGHL